MRIIYVARHNQVGSNDDEGAVAHALTALGHDVIRVQERPELSVIQDHADILLFHKWDNCEAINRVSGMKKVFWFFDRVYSGTPALVHRDNARREWMQRTIPLVDLGFCTDGDFARTDPKLHWLTQGADERVMGRGRSPNLCDIIFTGISQGGGTERVSFVEEVKARYGAKFLHISRGIYGRTMANMIAGAKIVVAPDFPVSDRYCSNRAYNVLGFGGLLLHPRCQGLVDQYGDGGISYYLSRDHMHGLIAKLLANDQERREISDRGLQQTIALHTYRHRCEILIQIVKEKLNLG